MSDDKRQRGRGRSMDEPDYSHWANLEYLTTLEATSLSLGGDPREFAGPQNPHGLRVEKAREYDLFADRWVLVERLVGSKLGVAPDELVRWMDNAGLEVPEGLRSALAARRSRFSSGAANLTDALAEIDKLKVALTQAQKDRDSFKALANKKSLRSLDKIAVGIAIAKYKWDPHAERGKAALKIADDLNALATFHEDAGPWRQQLGTDHDTVLKHLRLAFARLNNEADPD